MIHRTPKRESLSHAPSFRIPHMGQIKQWVCRIKSALIGVDFAVGLSRKIIPKKNPRQNMHQLVQILA